MIKEVVLEGRRVIFFPPKNKENKEPSLLIINGDKYAREYFEKNRLLRRKDILTALVVSPKRNDDYTPWPFKDPPPGYAVFGGKEYEYIAFLKDVLIPYIKGELSVNIRSCGILGQSLGGLANLYIAVREPELFSYNICISPSSWYQDFIKFLRENAHEIKTKNFYISCGLKEGTRCRDIKRDTVPLTDKIVEILKENGCNVEEYHDSGDHQSFIYERYVSALNAADKFACL